MDQKYILSSLDNALGVLQLFISHNELNAGEISSLSGLNKSTVFRILATLENRGYLLRKEGGRYALGLKLFTLGQLVYSRMELISIIHPYLEKLSRLGGETSHLSMMDDATHIVFLDKVVSSSLLRMDTPLGYHQFAHLTGTGKAILAFETERAIRQYLRMADFPQKTDRSIPGAKEFLAVLEEVRAQGYASDSEECEIGLTCYAVPVLDASGYPIAAISSSGPTSRMTARKEEHIRYLKEIAGEIHQILS
ncbi:IclR family transcriptional regulator [Anaerotignum lactatifermentans]|uniref:IclR family transcriptional regulator n=1 Tax=Anaerotignum lactatifermentans TaxID=160404 RepID=A0ABS2G8X7_9FIRM|nr:IclR family transcriptional regulator [Anaerotignum lactatifermentans]MBM6828878.1 IclR family transcriptional regulator [Anaerotignum lactatifermentans]MBM6876949.1 IclR family transcriptional regulator [Anaerotignum lactatifermentans]MBM6950507.1 IclR family transcriptional regulator [Anaerotignum lactatifermentans]